MPLPVVSTDVHMALLRGLKRVALLAILVAAVVSMGGVSGTITAFGDFADDVEAGISGGESPDTNGPSSDPQTDGSRGSATDSVSESPAGGSHESEADATTELNESRVELLVHQAVNDYRAEAGLDPLSYDRDLSEIADYHSENMADDGRIYHVSPEGEDFQDRYQQFDYDCRVPTDGNRYFTGGENVAQTWYEAHLTTGEYYDTEAELAEGLARQWYNSKDHRENMLQPEWGREGIGIHVEEVDGNLAIYATQNFC